MPVVSVAAPLLSTNTSPAAAERARLLAAVLSGVPLEPMLPPVEVRLRVFVVREVEVDPEIEDPA